MNVLTDKEMLQIAEKFIRRKVDESIEPIIVHEETIKKPYGNIYYYQSKEFLVTRDFNKHLAGNAPFLVEKKREGWLVLVQQWIWKII